MKLFSPHKFPFLLKQGRRFIDQKQVRVIGGRGGDGVTTFKK